MKLKLDEAGRPVLSDGKPVYLNDDGTELVFDADTAFQKIAELNRENMKHRQKAGEYRTQAEQAAEEARKAASGNLTAEQMLSAQKQAVEDLNRKLEASERKHKEQLRSMLVGGLFQSSKLIKDRLTIPPDIAQSFFGKNFTIEEDAEGNPQVVAKLNNQPILSRVKPGEVASFDEAMLILVEQYPHRDAISKVGTTTGSGSRGGSTSHVGKSIAQMTPQEKAAYIREVGEEKFRERLSSELDAEAAQAATQRSAKLTATRAA